ncbi:uncharacterized protein Pyn_31899 [Prunus yedoensis var. nudiflora]|uniref:Uncharacterized protein n=1 Tax=Prunus yedoensis var. nudiflora TaxID=2094558 RepID=A0A314ZD83_PRUYE|nr:uncharacterized protein Pyn_31899 [Prunus yedoensis var. nudiflora]
MASRMAARFVTRRLSSSGKVLGEEEKAAEAVYIKRELTWSGSNIPLVQYQRPKALNRKRTQLQAQRASISDAKPSGSTSGESTAKVSTDKYRNYAVVAGVVTIGAAAGWYLKSSGKKQEVQD